MHFRILSDHQKNVLKKDIFYSLEWFKTCLAHTSRPPETFYQKRYFWTSEVVKNVFWCIFAYFQTTRNFFSKKDIFERLKWLKTCFGAFWHTSRPPEKCSEKKYFWTSGVVQNVFWCICTYFQSTRIMSLKKLFLNVWSG